MKGKSGRGQFQGSVLLCLVLAGASQEEDLEALRGRVSRLVGLGYRKAPEVRRLSAEDLRKQTERQLDQGYREHLGRLDRTLSHFGLLQEDEDLAGTEGESPGVGAFYDPPSGALYLVGSPGQDAREAEGILVHELSHSLLHQHFPDLWKRSMEIEGNEDARRAIMAVIEGHAEWVREEAGFSFERRDGPAQGAPSYWMAQTSFPYRWGMEFIRKVAESGGEDWQARVFSNPPLSSEQILHPEKYLGDRVDWPTRIELPDLDLGSEALGRPIGSDSLGEFGMRFLVGERAAAGWDGDRFVVYEEPGGGTYSVWYSVWDSEEDAREFLEEYSRRFGVGQAVESGQDEITRRTNDRYSRMVRQGSDVAVLRGVPESGLPAIEELFRKVKKTELRRAGESPGNPGGGGIGELLKEFPGQERP